jgi:hypothetical protein
MKAGLGLLAAMTVAFAVSNASGQAHAAPAPAPAAAPDSRAADAHLADRQSRLLRWIGRARLEGWLSRPQARERYRTLGQLKLRERDLRQASGGELSPADRAALERDLDALAQDLRWARARAEQGRYRPH